MTRTILAATAALAVLLLGLSACGGDDDAATPTPSQAQPAGTVDPNAPATARPTRTSAPTAVGAVPQPCSLLSPAAIVPLIGNVTNTQPLTGECVYTGDTGTLTVHIEPKAATEADATQKLTEIAGSNAESAPVDNEGFYVSDAEIAGRKGFYVFTLTASKDSREVLLTLAQSASASLPTS